MYLCNWVLVIRTVIIHFLDNAESFRMQNIVYNNNGVNHN